MIAEFIKEARSYIGVPWRNGGRTKFGLDCGGLVIVSASAAGFGEINDIDLGYERDHWNLNLSDKFREHCGEPVDEMKVGDIVLMTMPRKSEPSHVGIVSDHPFGGFSLIHSTRSRGVSEHRLNEKWEKLICEIYRPFIE